MKNRRIKIINNNELNSIDNKDKNSLKGFSSQEEDKNYDIKDLKVSKLSSYIPTNFAVYNIAETALIIKVHPSTVIKEIKRNRLKAVKVGGEYRITEQALEEYLGTIANNYKTQREVLLEKENFGLKEKLSKYEDALRNIKSELLKI